jgi:hypothetical protein
MLAAARYASGGRPDRGFGHRGISFTRVGRNSLASSVSLDPTGKIVACGETANRNLGSVDFALVRYLP